MANFKKWLIHCIKRWKERNHIADIGTANIETIAAEALRDIGSDEEVSDTEDPDLLAELQVK